MHDKDFPKTSFIQETKRTLIVIASVVLFSWGISNADTLPLLRDLLKDTAPEEQRTFSTKGYISSIGDSSILIFNAKNKEGQSGFSYTVDIQAAYIKTSTGDALTFFDLTENQEIIAKGLLEGDTLFAHTIIVMPSLALEETATSTDVFATSTDLFASTTDTTSSSTEDSTSTQESSTNTDTLIDTVTDTITEVIDTVVNSISDTVSEIMDTLTGTSTPEDTILEETSSSTQSDTATPPVEETPTQEETPVEEVPQEEIEPVPASEEIPESAPEPEPNLEIS